MRLFNRNSISLEDRVLVWTRGRGETNALDLSEGLGVGAGSIYPVLYRLEERGALISRVEEIRPGGKPARRLYTATAEASP